MATDFWRDGKFNASTPKQHPTRSTSNLEWENDMMLTMMSAHKMTAVIELDTMAICIQQEDFP